MFSLNSLNSVTTSMHSSRMRTARLLVSTYVVCERLSVMQRQARLPEFFDQIAQNTLFWNLVQNTPPPENWNLVRSWHFGFWLSRTPLSPENWNLVRSWHFGFWLFRTPPPNWNLVRSWYFGFWLSRTSPPPKLKFWQILALAVSPKDTI